MHLYGRSSSHFTRIPRIFAAELEVDVEFHLIRDLLSSDAEDYGGNPALEMPTLQTGAGLWFGSLPICRELAKCSELSLDIVWPEHLQRPVVANAQELVLTAMSTEVGLIMGKASGVAADNAHQVKLRASLLGAIEWLRKLPPSSGQAPLSAAAVRWLLTTPLPDSPSPGQSCTA